MLCDIVGGLINGLCKKTGLWSETSATRTPRSHAMSKRTCSDTYFKLTAVDCAETKSREAAVTEFGKYSGHGM